MTRDQEEPREVSYAPDAALKTAQGNVDLWSAEMSRLVREVAGVEFDPATFVPWLLSFSQQVQKSAEGSLLLYVANFPVNAAPEGVIPAMRFRNQLVESLLP